MNNLSEFLSKNFNSIWTVVSVFIGGIITFSTTYALEKQKNKFKMQREKLDKILIPYCSSLESIQKINGKEVKDLDEWIEILNKPLDYLDAVNRVYLSRKSTKLLEEYNETLDSFKKKLEYESKDYLERYKAKFESVFYREFDGLISDGVSSSMQTELKDKIKLAILNKDEINLINYIKSIDFQMGDSPENMFFLTARVNDDIRFFRADDQSHIYDSHENELSCDVVDFIDNNEYKINKLMPNLENGLMNESLENIHNKVTTMTNIIIKEIDKITK